MGHRQTGPIVDLDVSETPTSIAGRGVLGTQIVIESDVFILGLSNGVTTAGDVCVANAGSFDFKTLTEADADDFDPMIAVCVATTADNDYAWYCLRHHEGTTFNGTTIGIKSTAADAADAQLFISGTAGQVQDGGTTSQHKLDGVRFKTATGTAAAAVNTTADFPNGIHIRGS